VFDHQAGQITRRATTSDLSTIISYHLIFLPINPPKMTESPQKEGRLLLAVNATKSSQIKSDRAAASLYDVSRTTLQARRAGRKTNAESHVKSRKLRPFERDALVAWCLDMDERGFPTQLIQVREMADALLAARNPGQPFQKTGKCWSKRFIKNEPRLAMKWNRKFPYQRARCEDPASYRRWFDRVTEMRVKYGILDEDTYNFDETGFMMGICSTSKVITSSDRCGKAITIQPGNRNWVTAIECISAAGWVLPPMVILQGKVHQSSWYTDISQDWVIAVSDNGWTTNELGVQWLKHFNAHTEHRVKGVYRLLIVDGHASHATPEFEQYCKDNKIISLCMPAHSSHLLQPLDVACFAVLKKAYGNQIMQWIRCGINHIDKEGFLAIYRRIRPDVFKESTIKSGFRATGLIPHDPGYVLSNLTVTKTPSPPGTSDGSISSAWPGGTPLNITQLDRQSQHLQLMLSRSSQSPTNQALRSLIKGCEMAMNSATILAKENIELRAANAHKSRKSQQSNHYIAHGGALQAQQGQFLVEQRQNGSQIGNRSTSDSSQIRGLRACGYCKVTGHNIRTCPNIIAIDEEAIQPDLM
jgi:hypothetical protein